MPSCDWRLICVVGDAGSPGILARISRIIAERGLIIEALQACPDRQAPSVSIDLVCSPRTCAWLERRLALEPEVISARAQAR